MSTYASTMTLFKANDSPIITPENFEHPAPTTYDLKVYSSSKNAAIYELSYWGMSEDGTDYSSAMNLWWNKGREHSPDLYNLKIYFTGMKNADVFLASNCFFIKQGATETACGKDFYNFGVVEGNVAHPFQMKIVPSEAYKAERPDYTTVKMSFQSSGNPVLYGAREKMPTFVGGDRSLLTRGSIFYTVLVTIMLSSVYANQATTTGINWSVT